MSSLPTSMVGSVLQSPYAQQHISALRDNERAQETSASQRQSKQIDEQDTTVETADEDTRVSPDTHGAGGQGRTFSSPDEPAAEQEEPNAPPSDDDIQHIDVQA